MKKFLLSLAVLVCSFLAAKPASASLAFVYVAQNQAGAGGGNSCIDAKAATFFNTSGNWGAGSTQIGPDTTVHWCGSGTAGANAGPILTFQGSGTSGHPITLLFESGSSMSATYWNPANGAIFASGKSFFTIDGASNGQIYNTLNGKAGATCPGGTCNTQHSSNGIVMNNVKNYTVQNMNVHDIFVNTASGGGGAVEGVSGACFDTENDSNSGASNVTITHNICRNSGTGSYYSFGSTDGGLVVSYNTISKINWGIAMGPQASGKTMNGAYIHNNNVQDFDNWDDHTGAYNYHHDGIFQFAGQTGSNVTNTIVDSNFVGGAFGFGTSAMYFDNLNGSGLTMTATVTNNVVRFTSCGGEGNGGSTAQNEGSGPVNIKYYNNTLWGADTIQGIWVEGTSVTVDSRNNIFFHWDNLLQMTGGASIPATTDYNLYNSWASNIVVNGGSQYGSLASWQSASGKDTHSTSSAPNLNATTYVPGVGSAAINAGTNLTSLGISQLNTDYYGIARPSVGAWDIGAVQSGSTPPPTPGTTGVVINGGTSISQLPSGIVNSPYSFTFPFSGGTPPYSWSVNPTIPGLSISAAGILNGIPSTVGTFSPTFVLVDSSSPISTATVSPSFIVSAVPPPPPPPSFSPIRIKPGTAYTDSQGNTWSTDTAFVSGGSVDSTSHAITKALPATTDQKLYQGERWGALKYTFSVPAGTYSVTLKMAEVAFTAANKRIFGVTINGVSDLSGFDLFASCGGEYVACDKTFPVTTTGSPIVIQFAKGAVDQPTIEAIQILQASAPPLPPIVVSIAPGSATVGVNGQVQFTDTVTNTTNSGVVWSTNAPNGLYTAPAISGTDVVTVASIADPTKSAVANITILPPPLTLSCTADGGMCTTSGIETGKTWTIQVTSDSRTQSQTGTK